MADKKWNVGDPVVVERATWGHRPKGQPYVPNLKHGTVTKVARKYFTAEFVETHTRYNSDETYTSTNSDEYEIANGVQRGDPNYTQYRDHAYTPEEWETQEIMRELREKLRDEHRVYGGNSDSTLQVDRWGVGHLLELLQLLDRVKDYNSQKDLNR